MAITSIGNQGIPQQILPPSLTDDSALRLQGSGGENLATGAIDAQVATTAAQRSASNGEPDRKTVESAVERLKNFVQSANSDVQFSIDEESGIRVIKVVDKETQEVVRQLPSKEVVEMAKALDKLQGLIFRGTA